MCVGFQEALIRSPGGTKSSPALEAQSPAWRISPQPPRGAVGNAAVSYYQCNIFKPIFKWAEGIISRALGPHRPLLPSLLLFFFLLPWVQWPGAVPQSQGSCFSLTRVSVLRALAAALSLGKILKKKIRKKKSMEGCLGVKLTAPFFARCQRFNQRDYSA